MAGLLTDLLAAGLVEKLDGNDERFEKMERAAKAVSEKLLAEPPMLIQAILAALDPDVRGDDPVILQAERALVTEWKSMNSVYPSRPIGLFRAILLEACSQADKGNAAAILWLTAADTLPLMSIGKEEAAVRGMLQTLAVRTEEAALVRPSMPPSAGESVPALEMKALALKPGASPRKVDRAGLLLRVAAAAGPNFRNHALTNPNPHWLNQNPQPWAWEYSDRMHAVIADELDALADDAGKRNAVIGNQVQAAHVDLAKMLHQALLSEQQWVRNMLAVSEDSQQVEQLRLNVLWWSEALYSNSMRSSYRELPLPLAPVVMAVDLLDQVTMPTPASVSYMLAETVHRLPGAAFASENELVEVLRKLQETRSRLPGDWMKSLTPPPDEGRLSLRDLIVLALGNQNLNLDKIMERAGLSGEAKLSLPALARALFRQEQAVRLAGSDG